MKQHETIETPAPRPTPDAPESFLRRKARGALAVSTGLRAGRHAEESAAKRG